VELADVRWDASAKTLSGTARVIGGEPFTIAVANNGGKVLEAEAIGAVSDLKPHSVAGLRCLTLSAVDSTDVKWALRYE
jgi:hypothetical protein